MELRAKQDAVRPLPNPKWRKLITLAALSGLVVAPMTLTSPAVAAPAVAFEQPEQGPGEDTSPPEPEEPPVEAPEQSDPPAELPPPYTPPVTEQKPPVQQPNPPVQKPKPPVQQPAPGVPVEQDAPEQDRTPETVPDAADEQQPESAAATTAPPAQSSSASPIPAVTATESAAPLAAEEAAQLGSEQTSSNGTAGGSPLWLQLSVVAVLLLAGVGYNRFMRRGYKHVNGAEAGEQASEKGGA